MNTKEITKAFKTYLGDMVEIPNKLDQKGEIDDRNSGWFIKYVFLKDEDGKNCLDFTAHHRMTNTRHERIHFDGKITSLEHQQECFKYDSDIKRDYEKKEQEYIAYNRRVSKVLKDKGL